MADAEVHSPMAETARDSLRRKLFYLAVLALLFVGTAMGLGWAFIRSLP